MKFAAKFLTSLCSAAIALSLGAAPAEKPVWQENFRGDNAKWKLNANAKIIDENGEKVLELASLTTDKSAQADFGTIPVTPSTWYELSFIVHGVQNDGMGILHNFFVLPMITYREIALVDANTPTQCLLSEQTKTVKFVTTSIQKELRLRLTAKAPGTVRFKNFVLREIEPPKAPAAEILLDMEFTLGSGIYQPDSAKEITGIVRIAEPETATVKMSVTDQAGNAVKAENFPAKIGDLPFAVPVPAVGTTSTLKFELVSADGKSIAAVSQVLHNYPNKPNQVTFRDDGMTLVNGKPFFMIAHWWYTRRGDQGGNVDWWYENDLDVADDMKFLHQAGFNTLLVRTPRQVELAAAEGLKALIEYPHKLPDDAAAKARAIAAFRAENAQYVNNPEFFAYYGPDEPMVFGFPLDKALESSALVHEVDPYHPIFYNESPTGTAAEQARYAKMGDAVGRDIYPVPAVQYINGELAVRHGDLPESLGLLAVGAHTDICHESVYRRKPVWMILQAFAWLHIYSGRNLKPVEEINDCEIIYPTYEENRFMAYNAITHGATGLMYHYLGYTVHLPEEFWVGFRQTILELNYLQDVLAGRIVYKAAMQCSAPEIRMLVKTFENRNYYILVNEADQAVEANLTNVPEKALYTLFADAPTGFLNGAAKVKFAPHEVKVMSEVPFKSAAEIFRPETFGRYNDFPVLRGKSQQQ